MTKYRSLLTNHSHLRLVTRVSQLSLWLAPSVPRSSFKSQSHSFSFQKFESIEYKIDFSFLFFSFLFWARFRFVSVRLNRFESFPPIFGFVWQTLVWLMICLEVFHSNMDWCFDSFGANPLNNHNNIWKMIKIIGMRIRRKEKRNRISKTDKIKPNKLNR